jgi:hypothetical protein
MDDLKLLFDKILVPGGSLIDIVIQDTTSKDWNKLFIELKKSSYILKLFRDSLKIDIPEDLLSLFTNKDYCYILRIQEENICINCHFFSIKEIEFDIDPRDFVAEEQYKIVIEFMLFLNRTLSKEVCLTTENIHDDVLFKIP